MRVQSGEERGGGSRRNERKKWFFFEDPNWCAYLIPHPITYTGISFTVVTTLSVFPIQTLRLPTGSARYTPAHLMPSAHLPFIVTVFKSPSLGSSAEEELGVRQSWSTIPALPCPWGYNKVTKATQVSTVTKVAAKGTCLIKASRSLFLLIYSTGITMALT